MKGFLLVLAVALVLSPALFADNIAVFHVSGTIADGVHAGENFALTFTAPEKPALAPGFDLNLPFVFFLTVHVTETIGGSTTDYDDTAFFYAASDAGGLALSYWSFAQFQSPNPMQLFVGDLNDPASLSFIALADWNIDVADQFTYYVLDPSDPSTVASLSSAAGSTEIVPEPATALLVAGGLGAIGAWKKRAHT